MRSGRVAGMRRICRRRAVWQDVDLALIAICVHWRPLQPLVRCCSGGNYLTRRLTDDLHRQTRPSSLREDRSIAPGVSSGQAVALMERLAGATLPRGMGFEWTGLTYQ